MRKEATHYQVIFGSNLITECPSVIKLEGKGINQQIIRFKIGRDGKILFDCKVKDEEGRTVTVVANSLVQHVDPDYNVDISDNGIVVKNNETGDVWLEFVQMDANKFKLNGRFFIPGYRIIATDEYLDINTNKFIGSVFQNCSAAIGLG